MINLVNYIYSIAIRMCSSKTGVYHGHNHRVTYPIVFFGLGGLIGLILLPFLHHPAAVLIGMIISPVIWLLWYLLIGFEYLDKLKNMSLTDTIYIFIVILLISFALVTIPLYILV